MSRSRKKEPFEKDPNNSQGKKFANRKLRRAVKQALHNEEEIFPALKEVMNTYDLVDWSTNGHTLSNKDDAENLKRK